MKRVKRVSLFVVVFILMSIKIYAEEGIQEIQNESFLDAKGNNIENTKDKGDVEEDREDNLEVSSKKSPETDLKSAEALDKLYEDYTTQEEDISVNLDDTKNKIIQIEQKNEKEYKIILLNAAVPEGTKQVKFPIWSKMNGQDDIVWYEGQKQEEGSYAVDLKLSNHKGTGFYYIHAYAVTENDQYIFLGNTDIIFDTPTIANIGITEYNLANGTFRVMLTGINSDSIIRKLEVPVWSEAGGQDDLIWYTAKKNREGEYYVDVNIKNHKYSMGAYSIHTYITDVTGYQYFSGANRHVIEPVKGTLAITQNSEKEYVVELKGVNIPGGAKQIEFPVWSVVNGQDDIRWYVASKVNENTYRCRISVANHKGLGQFLVHAYAKMPNESMVYLGAADFKTASPEIGKIEASITNKKSGQFQIKISGIKNSGLISQIQVPTWSESRQGDIVWYTAVRDNSGNYIVNTDISRHKYNCAKYNIHVYLTDISGAMQFAGGTTCDMTPGYQSLEVKDISGTESTYRITLSDLSVPSGEKELLFAVWGSTGGQNDLRWYTARKQSDGTYTYDVRISDHKELGKYIVHVYCRLRNNNLHFVGATGFELVKKPLMAQVKAGDLDGSKGTFKVTATGITSISGIKRVQIPIWCSDNQSDIVWYDAVRTAEGTYTVNVNVAKHGHHFGNYKIHVYVTSGNGIQSFVGGTTAKIEAVRHVYNISLGVSRQEIGIMGITAQRVQFPTWSETNGQDDIVWYEGVYKGDGKWSVVVDSKNHRHSGKYVTHVYADGAFMGGISYQMKKNGVDLADVIRNAGQPLGRTLYVWGGGWNAADTAAGETATHIGVWPEWEAYFNQNRNGYSYLPGKRAWERGERQWRFKGLDCSGYLGWIVYNSVQEGRNAAGYVVSSSRLASSLTQYGYGTATACTPRSVFRPGDIVSISGHCFLCLGQCSDGSVLVLHSTPNGGVQVSGTVSGNGSSQASRLAQSYMQQHYPQWWASFGGEGRQRVNASTYLNGTKFSWTVNNLVGDSENIQMKSAEEVLNYLR